MTCVYPSAEYFTLIAGDVRDCPQCLWKHCVTKGTYFWECQFCFLCWDRKGLVHIEPDMDDNGKLIPNANPEEYLEYMRYTSPYVLYRLWNADHQLLYIGITNKVKSRMKWHERHQIWWHHVASKTFEYYIDRKSLVHAETKAIRRECPKWNVVHNTWE